MTSPGAENVFQQVDAFVTETQESRVNQQNAQVSALAATTKSPIWMARYPEADVTFPEALMQIWSITGTTGSTSAHTHTIPFSVGNVASGVINNITQNQSMGSYVNITQARIMDKMGLYVAKTLATSINNVFMEIFRENSDTSLTRVFSTDISASLGTSYAWFEATITGGLVVQPGERYLVRLRNASSVSNDVSSAGIWRTTLSPDVAFWTTGSTLTAQTSYTAAEAATARAGTIVVLFIMLAQTGVTSTPRSYSDDFTRGSFGGLWRLFGTAPPSIYLSRSAINAPLSSTPESTTTGVGIYTLPTNTDDALVECSITSPLIALLPTSAGPLLHCTNDGTSGVQLRVDTTSATIYSGNPITGGMTSRASVSLTNFADAKWSLYYNTATTTYTAMRNNADIGLSWNDSGNLAGRSVLKRYGGFRVNGSNFTFIPIASPEVDNWTLRDYTP